jgi:hypothetical protein
MSLNERLATVLEKTADYLDAQDAEKTAAAQDERRKLLAEFSEKYASVTGEELPEDALAKLATSDAKLLSAFQKLAAHVEGGNTNDAPEDLGEPGDMPDGDPVYMTKKAELAAKTQAAGDSFLAFIMSE